MQHGESDHHAPEGAVCAVHSDRPASFTCPRCGSYACLFCWHGPAQRCDACLRRDPAAAAAPLPWETREGSLIGRMLGTLATAMHPVQSAPAFARRELRPALAFFALTAIPFAALAGVIPNTKTLMFGTSFDIVIQGHPSQLEIVLDVLKAMLLQLASFGLDLVTLSLPFVSLVRAYTPPELQPAALRVLLYRSWLAPAAMLLMFLGIWMLPGTGKPNEPTQLLPLLLAVQFTCNVILLVSMRATAQLACGINGLLSFLIVVIALTVCGFSQLFVAKLLHLPVPPSA